MTEDTGTYLDQLPTAEQFIAQEKRKKRERIKAGLYSAEDPGMERHPLVLHCASGKHVLARFYYNPSDPRGECFQEYELTFHGQPRTASFQHRIALMFHNGASWDYLGWWCHTCEQSHFAQPWGMFPIWRLERLAVIIQADDDHPTATPKVKISLSTTSWKKTCESVIGTKPPERREELNKILHAPSPVQDKQPVRNDIRKAITRQSRRGPWMYVRHPPLKMSR